MSLKEIGYVVETISIFGRTTAVVRLHNKLICACTTPVVHAVANCYTPTIIQTYDTPSSLYKSLSISKVIHIYILCIS